MIYEYKARLSRVVDGDTVHLFVDLGFRVTVEVNFRLARIDTPEVVGKQRSAGLISKSELQRLLDLGPIRVVSKKSDKYGRWLAEVYVQTDGPEINVNQYLLDNGFALLYDGTGPKPVK